MDELARDGVRLCFVDAGKGAPPVVLVHDLARDHTCLEAELEHFRQRHRTVAVDLRGHGESGKPEQAYTMAGFADDLAWLAYELGLYRPVVVGYGLGGAVALELAARVRDLPGAVVAVDTPIRWLTPSHAPSERAQGLPAEEGVSSVDSVGGGLAPPLDGSSEQAVCGALLPPLGCPPAAPRHVLVSALGQLTTWDGAAALAACEVPVLYVETGASGGGTTDELSRLRDLCPRLAIARAAHGEDPQAPPSASVPLARAERVIAAVDRFVAVLPHSS